METDTIKERWSEYIHELYDSSRDEIMELNDEGPEIMKEEVEYALKK